jgi:hypothetical protein
MPLSPVPQFRQDVAFTSVVAGAPVASTDWQRVAAVQNWIAGRGRQVIPTFKPDHGSNKATTFRYSLYILPSYSTIDLVAMAATNPLQTVVLPGSISAPVPIALSVSPRGAYSSSAITLDLDIVAPINPDITVESIAVYEIPRAQIEQTALAGGVDAIALAPSQPITIASVDVTITYASPSSSSLHMHRLFHHHKRIILISITNTSIVIPSINIINIIITIICIFSLIILIVIVILDESSLSQS